MRKISFSIFTLFFVFVSSITYARVLPDFADLIEQTSPAVVKINTVSKVKNPILQIPQGQQIPDIFRHFFEQRGIPEREARAMGSGFFVSSDGYIITNNHVVDSADQITVRLVDRREYEAKLIGTDRRSDLALLKIEEKNLPFLKFGDADKLRVGEWVVAIGSPFGLDFSASAGIVSAMGRSIPTENNENYVPFIQTDVAINPGNSGGPLFNLDGEVVGVNSQIITPSGGSIGLSFAIPSSVASSVFEQLQDKGRVDRGWLGVVIQDVDKSLADSFGLDKPMGALVAELVRDAPAIKGGVEVGDVILSFNGVTINASGDLPHAVGAVQPGEKVAVKVMRRGKMRSLTVEIGALPGEAGDDIAAAGSSSVDGGRLGVVVSEADRDMLKEYRVPGGVIVENVSSDSAAEEAGLRVGDVITQIGYQEIKGVQDFKKMVTKLPANKPFPIRFFREGRPVFRTIVVKADK